jgi:maltooligosyltrehalose trehalohydrolase
VELRVWAPYAPRVDAIVDGARHGMRDAGFGWRAVDLDRIDRYAFSLDGGPERPDPRSRFQPDGVHARSAWVELVPPRGAWRGFALRDAVLYEVHVGTFTPEGTLDAATDRLDHLVALGVNAVELMPLAAFSGRRGWGYDGVGLYAVHEAYGGPLGLRRFIDACHARGIAVVLDVVYNHLGPDGNYVAEFGPYFTDRHKTPWGEALNFDGRESDNVRAFVLDNATQWFRDFGVDGLRLDAVQAIIDMSAVHILEELSLLRDRLGAELGRTLWLIAESDLNDPRLVESRDRNGYGLDAQWSDDFHHALHVALTGERVGYYSDYTGLPDLAKALTDAFVYDGRYSHFRHRRHGRPVGALPSDRFVVSLQNHDQIGNRARGERIAQLAGVRRAQAAAALALTTPFVPLLFMGEEWAAGTPFLYFTDHTDPTLARAVSDGRRYDFAAFGWQPDHVPDPQDPATFEASRLDWSEPSRSPHRETLEWYRSLLRLRRDVSAIRESPRGDTSVALDAGAGWIAITRGPLQVVVNLGRERADVPLSGAGSIAAASDEAVDVGRGRVRLPAESAAVLLQR